MRYIDNFLNRITMYRVVLYGLTVMVVASIIFGFTHLIAFKGLPLVYSVVYITFACVVFNYIFSKIFRVQTNVESVYITAFILYFVMFPVYSWGSLIAITLVCLIAMGSKYLLAIRRKHIFNPVAIAIFLAGVYGSGIGVWWVATPYLTIIAAIVGFLILRKIDRFQMFGVFLICGVASVFVTNYFLGLETSFVQLFKSWPIIFLGTIMLTEPMTTPHTHRLRLTYGAFVGILFGVQFHIGPIYSTPELALVLGNIFSYIVSPKYRLKLKLKEKNKLSPDVYDYVFEKEGEFTFTPGQYMEWTLGHSPSDTRGNRRYFTIASSPTENEVRVGTKFYPNSSTFKKALLDMPIGNQILASQLSGSFTLPKDKNKKLVFIAGGIGVTPFRSIVKYLIDTKETRDIVLLYSAKTPADLVYKEIFEGARTLGLKNFYVVNDLAGAEQAENIKVGMINDSMIKELVPDFESRMFYISGPHVMVSAFQSALKKMGVRRKNIKVDFFPGFV